MPVQTTYSLEHDAAFPGLRADLSIVDIISKAAEDSAIGFGLAVVQGTADNQCKLPTALTGEFLGITERQLNDVANSSDVAEYAEDSEVNIVRFGRVWAECEDGCSPGDPVYYRVTAAGAEEVGALRTDDDSGDGVLITGATWRTTATAGNLAIIELGSIGDSTAETYEISSDTIAAAGAVSLTVKTTLIDSTVGAIAITLADGTEGQEKIIKMTVDGGDATLTPANLFDGTTLTFGDVNDSALLKFVGGTWLVIANNGVVIA